MYEILRALTARVLTINSIQPSRVYTARFRTNARFSQPRVHPTVIRIMINDPSHEDPGIVDERRMPIDRVHVTGAPPGSLISFQMPFANVPSRGIGAGGQHLGLL